MGPRRDYVPVEDPHAAGWQQPRLLVHYTTISRACRALHVMMLGPGQESLLSNVPVCPGGGSSAVALMQLVPTSSAGTWKRTLGGVSLHVPSSLPPG